MSYHIYEGDIFLCIKDVVMMPGGRISYTSGVRYRSDSNNCITDNDGCRDHTWSSGYKKYFINVKEDRDEKLIEILN